MQKYWCFFTNTFNSIANLLLFKTETKMRDKKGEKIKNVSIVKIE